MQYKLTIIMPTCNRNDTLSRAIDTVLYQGVENIEIVVVNDGVDEIPVSITEAYSRYPFVTFIKNTGDKGAAGARNFGVKNANGYFISFLDDDDIYLPGRLANMLSEMESKQSIFVSSGRFYEISDFAEIHNVPDQYTGKITLENIKYANDIDIGFMISRSDFLRIGGFDSSFTNLEDWDFVIRMLKEGNGYKLGRLDYAVNIDPNRARVSNNDYKGYRELAAKYKSVFDKKWYFYMLAMADRLEHKLTATCAIKYSISSGSKLPFILYLKYKLQFLKYKKF
jgi:GT2 family glycosyltransferase